MLALRPAEATSDAMPFAACSRSRDNPRVSEGLPPASGSGPGRIVTFAVGDGVGQIRLDGGETLRFGARVCKGFVPAVGMRVVVTELGPHPLGGTRALAVELAPDARAEADAILEAQRPAPSEDAAAVARSVGVLTVLLRAKLEPTRGAVRTLFGEAGIAELGVQLDEGTMRYLARGSTRVAFAVGNGTYPREGLDLRFAPDALLGQSFVVFTGVVPAATAALVGDSPTPDLWQSDGSLQLVTQIARRMIASGLVDAIVVHRAGDVVRTPAEWLRTTQTCDEPGHRAFLPWLDLGSDEHTLRSYGMSAMWLPDLEVPLDRPGLDPGEAYARGHEAIQYACHQLVHRHAWLRPGDRVSVPVAVQVDAGPLDVLNAELDRTPVLEYVVVQGEERLRLEPQGAWPLAGYWERADRDGTVIAYPIYRELLLAALAPTGRLVASLSFEADERVPLHEVLVLQRDDGLFLLSTCGIARVPQPRGEDADDDRRIEMLLLLSTHAPELAEFLSSIARIIHSREPTAAPIGPEHRVTMAFERGRLRMGAYMIGWGGHLELGQGPKISLYAPVAMTPAETDALKGQAKVKWLHGEGSTPEVRERWLRMLEH